MKKSKRLIFAIIALGLNYVLFAGGIILELDLVALSTGLALLNTPLYTYIFGETVRKSEKK